MKKILLVDDSSTIRNIIRNGLTAEYEVCEAENGKKALQVLAGAGTVSLFLLDVNMPEMDGLTLLGELRKLPEHKSTPVLMLTTETKEEFRSKAKALGATGWVVKPCEPEKLLETIRMILA
jgi:Response regulators consisting of a CheY-like receiver domain and a winged-helix DNA-binding domain